MIVFKIFKFTKGKHDSKPCSFKLLTCDRFYISWQFNKEPLQNNDDTNKLFGMGYFPHHMRKSWRIGYSFYKGKMVYSLFLHIKGKFEIHPIPDMSGLNGALKIFLLDNDIIVTTDNDILLLKVPFPRPKWNFGYMLGPYHGGDDPALNNYQVNLFVSKLKTKK